MAKRWSKAEVNQLKKYAASESAEQLAERLGADVEAVRRKLDALGLAAADAKTQTDAAVEDYAKALELLYAKSWKKAAALLEKVAGAAAEIHLADRARQGLAICHRELEKSAQDGEPYLQAVFEKNAGNLEAALGLCDQKGANKDERFVYLRASIHALAGAEDEALEQLAAAIRLEPKNRIHAYHDPDFQALRGREEFSELVQAT